MSNYVLNVLLFRFLLPIIIATCVVFRPSGLSAIYLIVLCYLPFVPVPSLDAIRGHTGLFLKLLVAISVLTSLCQLTFQIVLLLLPPYAHFLEEDALLEKILRHVGFVRLNHISIVPGFIWLAPEVVMFLTSIIFFILLRKLNCPSLPGVEDSQSVMDTRPKSRTELFSFVIGIGRYGVLAMLCLAAIARPSVPGGLYYLIFLCSATWWACYKQLGRGFAVFLCCLLPIVFVHLCSLFAYQFEWSQEIISSNSSYTRYFGLTALILVKEDKRDYVFASNQEWATFVNPFILYALYTMIILESKELLKAELQKKQGAFSRLEGSFTGELGRQMSQRLSKQQLLRSAATKKKWQAATRKVRIDLRNIKENKEPTENTPLIRGGTTTSKKPPPSKKSGIIQDSTGSVTVTGDIEDIPFDVFDDEDYEGGWFENVIFVMGSILQIIVRSSYIVTNIIMMAWSITYLSWVTFVLLLWANLIWLIPNQRKNMLHSSPFLVIYAWFLLIAAYIYSMDLTEDELPSMIDSVDLSEIGFVKVKVLPCVPLFVKCLYTVMFWVTLRQYMQERVEAKQSSALADMVAPLQVTVGTAAGVNKEKEKTGSKLMERIGQFMKHFFTKFWIWVVAITLFAVAITGERMTVFRIVYMALFLFFILSFQISFHVWRKVMFAFWLTVIIYSMIILVLVYTYQFKNFPSYWESYLHIPKEQQLDIGLEQYKTKQLFVRLVTPTFFVIVTVLQLHYFHDEFMALSDPKNTSIITDEVAAEVGDQSSLQGGAYIDRTGREDRSSSVQYNLYELGHLSSVEFQHLAQEWLKRLHRAKNLMFLFLELHMIKIVFLFAMLMCVYDKCAVYFVIVVLIPVAFTCGRPMQICVIYASSLLVSLLLLGRMIYQIQYIRPGNWNVTCEVHNNPLLNETVTNIAPWLGFRKVKEGESYLISLVQWNIIYIVIVTLWSVILVRQYNYRMSRGRPTTRAFFMFPNITIEDSNKNLKNYCKYMANYAFFKFGVEISLIMTVILIGVRMDGYAVLYAMWLITLFSLKRKTLSRVWVFYLMFIACALPWQYFMAVGLPPVLCQEFPWDRPDPVMRGLQDWAFLLDNYEPPPVEKLIYDFLVLVLVSRQWVVFRIEKRYEGQSYAGGSNESIIHEAEQKDFENPVPDFITFVRSYLDILKKAVLQSFLWITLAIVFIAGTNRVNIFSIGYLLGAFVFLWHGSDFYLRPIPKILRQWQILLGYNVSVIFIKTCFQLLGCVYLHHIPSTFCFLVQLLGIGCVKKFTHTKVPLNPIVSDDIYESCEVPNEFMGIAWDTICFALLIFQKRIFNSYNFFHIVDDTKATTILASRGAELIEEMRLKTMKEQEEMERKVLEKIRMKMDRIKANQQKIQGDRDTDNHYVERPPLAKSSSASSCTSATSQQSSPGGYHTPIDEEEPAPLTPRSSLMNQQAPPSPYSAVMTVSLEGYLEPQRMSFSSPPNSELNPRPTSPDDSFPVFSPPPYNDAPPTVVEASAGRRKSIGIGPPWMQGSFITPRQSVISYSSRSALSHHEYSIFSGRPKYRVKPPVTYKEAIRSGDYYMFDELEDEDIDLLPEEKSVEEDDRGTKPDMVELLATAFKSDVSSALRRRSSVTGLLHRQMSMPLARRKSSRSHYSAAFSAPPTIQEREPRSVRIKEIPEDDPHPGTSKDEEELSELSVTKEKIGHKILTFLLFIWAFIDSGLVSLTNFLNKYSRNYRYVLKVLAKEKKILKERTHYNVGVRLGPGQIWQPAGSYHSLLRHSADGSLMLSGSTSEIMSPTGSYKLAVSLRRMNSIHSDSEEKPTLSEDSGTKVLATSLPCSSEQDRKSSLAAPSQTGGIEAEELSSVDQPTIFRLMLAVWYTIMSRSEILCYFIIFLNQTKNSNFISLPLPLMVFFWGSLTIPRPTKTFWVTIIAYTEVIVLLKCIFQFEMMPGNAVRAKTEFVTTISDTNPFFPPAIIGLRRMDSYYAMWDLFLLLVVFFHRVLLKSMGIWSSSGPVTAALSDGDYRLENGKLVPLSTSSPNETSRGQEVASTSRSQRSVSPVSHKSVSSKDENVISVKIRRADKIKHLSLVARMAVLKYMEHFKLFIQQLLDPASRVPADVYSLMFLCDFVNFFVILFGYSSFGAQQDGGVSDYLQDNRVPALFLFMLIFQFMLIVIDRGIYLRKNILGKLIFQFFQIVLLHIWLFILFPIITGKQCNAVLPPQIYYMVKCFYLLFSAYQVRCGYPTRILGNFLCKSYGYINMFLFRGFMLVPFLFELRTCMDWMWTETSMTIFDWIKMEDIYSHIFLLKCSRHVEDEYPQPRGEKKKPFIKYLMGGAMLTVIIGIIWFPLVFFSLGNAVGEANLPSDVTVEIRIGPYEPVYKMSAQSNSIFGFTSAQLEEMKMTYASFSISETFLYNYEAVDVAAIKLSSDSANIWAISPPDRKRMVAEINSTSDLKVRLDYKVSHKTSKPEDSGILASFVEIKIPPSSETNDSSRENLLEMLAGKNADPIPFRNLLPKFLKVTSRGTVSPVEVLMVERPDAEDKRYRNITLRLLRPNATAGSNVSGVDQEWWHVQEECDDYNNIHFLKKLAFADCSNSIVIYTFNDKVFPPTLNFITAGGILGLYTTLVFVASRVLRGFFADGLSKIMFEDMPNVDRVLQLCLDIYLVREVCEFALEEDLFAKLVFLFRSPETLIKWTRPKEEVADDDDPEGDGE